MATGRSSHFLDPSAAALGSENPAYRQKAAVIQEARSQAEAIYEKLRRIGHDIPKYTFLELIGKGAYGRVFKCHDEDNDRIVALKVIDVDSADYKVNARAKDENIEVTIHEIKVLKQLKDSMAKNVNMFFDAFQIHSQLWIVNDYCPGGSVHTLMRATRNKLDERYILPIARELAEGLKAIHDAGIIHRDVKSANVMIHENGSLQVIDFGVAAILETKLDKRNTIIGTPHWMPPELHKNPPPGGLTYGTEVDVWSYGCTLIECATGQPPNPRVEPGRRLGTMAARNPPRLNGDQYSEGLRDLVASILQSLPAARPTMEQILREAYIYKTELDHPTKVLAELVKIYYRWELSGGQRQSLFYQGGAAAVEYPQTMSDQDEWNFSTTAGFEQQIAHEKDVPPIQRSESLDTSPTIFNTGSDADLHDNSHLPLSTHPLSTRPDRAGNLSAASVEPPNFSSEFDYEPPQSPSTTPIYTPSISTGLSSYDFTEEQTARTEDNVSPRTVNISAEDAYRIEERVKRGERAMEGIFNEKKAHYKYEVKDDFENDIATKKQRGKLNRPGSDLPLRSINNESSVHREVEYSHGQLQADPFDMPNIDLANVDTIKAKKLSRRDEEGNIAEPLKRATKDWTFPSFDIADIDIADTVVIVSPPEPSKRATMAWKFPTAIGEETSLAPPRPRLHHATTAPVGELHHQSITVLDLDDLYNPADFAPPPTRFHPSYDDEGSTIRARLEEGKGNGLQDEFRDGAPAPTAFPLHPSPTQEEVAFRSRRRVRSGQHTSADVAHARSATSSDEETLYDPFFGHFERPVSTKEIEQYITSTGVIDPLEIAVLRRDIVQGRNGADKIMKRYLYQNGYKDFQEENIDQAQGMYELTRGDPSAWWGNYNPENSPAPDVFQNPNATEEEEEMAENRHNEIPHTWTSESVFNNLAPPSAASLTVDAPAPVVEAELARLLTTFHAGLEEMLGAFGDDDDNADKRHIESRNGGVGRQVNGVAAE